MLWHLSKGNLVNFVTHTLKQKKNVFIALFRPWQVKNEQHETIFVRAFGISVDEAVYPT